MNTTLANATLTTMNATMLDVTTAAASTADSTEHQFSRLNVIGMFITLQLCQFTQPHGSLLWRNVTGSIWRCNPLSSIVEALIIYWHLGTVLLQNRRAGHSVLFKKLQETSGALLLLRGAIGTDDEGRLMDILTSTSRRFEDEGASGVYGTSTSQELDITTQAQQRTNTGLSRSSTIEAGRPAREGTGQIHNPRSERYSILREALGSNALAHKEYRIDLFTAFTMFTIFVKLVTVRGSGWFTAAAMLLLWGWCAVWVLLLFHHLHDIKEDELSNTAQTLRFLNTQLETYAILWLSLFALLHLPFLGYPAYLAAFSHHPEPSHKGISGTFFESLMTTFSVVGMSYSFTIFLPAGLIFVAMQVPGRLKYLLLLLWPVFCVFSYLTSYSYYRQTCEIGSVELCTDDFVSIFHPPNPLYYIVDRGFSRVVQAIGFFVLFALISTVYFLTIMSFHGGFEKSTSFGNACFVLAYFVVYLCYYDPTTTWKPSWTEVLG